MARPRKAIQVGRKINMLTVVGPGEPQKTNEIHCRSTSVVRCDCGVEKTVANNSLLTMKIISCGCYGQIAIGIRAKTHGLSVGKNRLTYASWTGMHVRCYNESYHLFHRYGGRGIFVCDRWHVVENFFDDMGIKPENTSLDRIDSNGNYGPGNCRWATSKLQSVNRTSSTFFKVGETVMCLKQWSEHWGISRYFAGKRLADIGEAVDYGAA